MHGIIKITLKMIKFPAFLSPITLLTHFHTSRSLSVLVLFVYSITILLYYKECNADWWNTFLRIDKIHKLWPVRRNTHLHFFKLGSDLFLNSLGVPSPGYCLKGTLHCWESLFLSTPPIPQTHAYSHLHSSLCSNNSSNMLLIVDPWENSRTPQLCMWALYIPCIDSFQCPHLKHPSIPPRFLTICPLSTLSKYQELKGRWILHRLSGLCMSTSTILQEVVLGAKRSGLEKKFH